MGFCIYCNKNVYGNTTCPTCYRTVPVTNSPTTTSPNDTLSSRFTALFPEEKRLSQKSSTDKWQDTYSKKAIFNNGQSSAAPLRPRQQRVMPQFNTSNSAQSLDALKRCVQCQGVPWAVDESNLQVRVCEPCKMIGRSLPPHKPESSSTSTPVLSSLASPRSSLISSSSPKSNPYFQFQRSRRTSMFNTPNTNEMTGPAPKSTVSTSAIASPTSQVPPFLSKYSNDSVKSTSPIYRRSTTASPPPPPQHEALIEPIKTESTPRKRKVVKKPCKECGQYVHKKDYRGLKIHTGQVLCYHSYCLFCAKCQQSFNGLDFCTDGTSFYHVDCSLVDNRQGSPFSEEEEPYPQTPPPHDTEFQVHTTQDEFHGDEDLPKKQPVIDPGMTTTIMCHTCTLPVTDTTCLELANHFYHKECLLCAGCEKTVPTDRQLSKHDDKLYCEHCTPPTTTPNKKKAGLRIEVDTSLPKRAPTITTPSDIFKSRKKVLPRLGGVRSCARCNESMPFSDTQPGPNASRWHKKCLRCTGCKKQMDSDAHMTVNEETGLCLVHCRECLDETPKPRFVR